MKKVYVMLSIIAILALLTPVSVAHAKENGVDDLRGRWDFEWVLDGNEENPPSPLGLYINDLVENPYMPDMFFAGGCMRSPDSDVFMPLSLLAVPDPENGTYDVTIYSTVVPDQWEPFVIRFKGMVEVNGNGVPDDVAGGEVTTEFGTGQWTGIHHDRRRTKCPSAGYGQFVQADVRLSSDLAFDPPRNALVLELYTVVVSTAMQVDMPDGSTRIIEPYTDLFSPHVDFVGRFRFFEYFEGEQPVVGEPYTFRLLDMFGNPIPGTESTDVFWRCTQDAPRNVSATDTFEGDVTLDWDPVPVKTGEFEPLVQVPDSPFHLPYQVNVHAVTGKLPSEFGALGVSDWHIIPWEAFEPGGDGQPDGFDFGESLANFEDGLYQIGLDSWNMPVVDQGGYYQDCEAHDSSENLIMDVSGGNITFTPSGTISGDVTSGDEDPIADVWVDACEFDNEETLYCQSGRTNAKGHYRIAGLLPGDYRVFVWGGQGGWIDEFYPETRFYDEATPVPVSPGADTGGIDFTMELGGSISGTVFADGNPVVDIWVDACHESVPVEEWGQSPLCYGAPTNGDGYYELTSLQPGNYRVVVWGDESYVAQFYDGVPTYDDASLVPIAAGQVAENTNFNLTIAGSISGTVLADGNPVVDIWVDACHESVPAEEWGQSPLCNGAPTNGDGYYEIHGLQPGNYRVVTWGNEEFGHEFYNDVQEFLDATLVPVVAGQTAHGIDFTLEIFVEPSPQFLNVQPYHMWAHSGGWAVGVEVTLSFGTYSETLTVPADGNMWFDLSDTGISPGVNVNITGGDDSKDLLVVSASFEGVNDVENTAWGTAPAGEWLGVAVVDENGDFFWIDNVQAQPDNTWLFDFDDYGKDFAVVTDAWVHVFDEDGDSTLAHLEIPGP